MTYSEKLKDPRWQKRRLKILERDNFTCTMCGDTKTTLHVHHEKYQGIDPWDTPAEHLVTHCEDCHSLIERTKNSGWPILSIRKCKCRGGDMVLFCRHEDKVEGCFFSIYQLDVGNRVRISTIMWKADIEWLFKELQKGNDG